MRHDFLAPGGRRRVTEAVLALGAMERQGLATLFEGSPHQVELQGQAFSISLARLDEMLSGCALAPILPATLGGAVRKRQLSFLGGRLCAEKALADLGLANTGVPVGRWGEPVWPDGVLGSITHTSQCAFAFVAADNRYLGVGIDSEEVGETAVSAIVDLCCTNAEREAWIRPQADAARVTAIFCAKEALYKAAHHMVQRFIGFDEVETVEFNGETLVLRPVEEGVLDGVLRDVTVRIVNEFGFVHASVAIGLKNVGQNAPALSGHARVP